MQESRTEIKCTFKSYPLNKLIKTTYPVKCTFHFTFQLLCISLDVSSCAKNNKISQIHERRLRVICKDKKSTFYELLEKVGSVSIHERNLRFLACERGFNKNKSVLKINKKEKSVVSPKLILDHMQKNMSLISTFKITNKLVRCVKAFRQLYKLDRERQKKSAKQDESNQWLTILKCEIKDVMPK